MDINHIQLNPSALAGLYKNHLVESVGSSPAETKRLTVIDEPLPPAAPVNKGIKALGNNERKVLVLVNHKDVVFLPDEELKFLTGILAACKLSIADVSIVNLCHWPETGYKDLLTQFSSTRMLLFGLEPGAIGLPLSFPDFQLQAFNGCTYHWCPDLGKMENDRTLKTQLWNNLKKLFTI
jgi:hypothetical protein